MPRAYRDSDGDAVNVTLSYPVPGQKEPVYVQGWLGLAEGSGNSGESVALTIEHGFYQVLVPSSLTLNKGDVLYVILANVTAHVIPDNAWATSAAAGRKAFMKLSEAPEARSDGKQLIIGVLLPEGV